MASIQNSINAYKTIHNDYQQLDYVKTVLMDCTNKLNGKQNSRKEIAKLTKLALEVLDVVSGETMAGLKTLAPSHSYARVLASNEAQKKRELAGHTGYVVNENDPETNLREFLKRKKNLAPNNESSVVSPSPKKYRRSERQMLNPSEREFPFVPENCIMFSPVELYNILKPQDSSDRVLVVNYFIKKNWLYYTGKDPGRSVRRFMQHAVRNPEKIRSY